MYFSGYILGPSDQMETERLIGIREINSLGVAVLRFVLHVSLFEVIFMVLIFMN